MTVANDGEISGEWDLRGREKDLFSTRSDAM